MRGAEGRYGMCWAAESDWDRKRTEEGNVNFRKRVSQIESALLHQRNLKLDTCAHADHRF